MSILACSLTAQSCHQTRSPELNLLLKNPCLALILCSEILMLARMQCELLCGRVGFVEVPLPLSRKFAVQRAVNFSSDQLPLVQRIYVVFFSLINDTPSLIATLWILAIPISLRTSVRTRCSNFTSTRKARIQYLSGAQRLCTSAGI